MTIIQTSGRRKKSIARAVLKPGSGKIVINNKPLNLITPKISMMKIKEALEIAGDVVKKVDIRVRVFGGGFNSQAEAVRTAISKALVEFEPKLKEVFLEYDRSFLVNDVRYKETKKPGTHGRARAKRQKSYR
ncbi:30S ribosomal protein S9 [Candidatus Woesearchaeota archaeon ex4484_78]|nr:MAG: 30S ribosomal protein S9 [Candidatus Woesearchaeota archaeon ex4484_78]